MEARITKKAAIFDDTKNKNNKYNCAVNVAAATLALKNPGLMDTKGELLRQARVEV